MAEKPIQPIKCTKSTITFIVFTCATFILLLSSCKKDVTTKTNDIRFDSISISDTYRATNNAISPACTINVNYTFPIEYTNEEALSNIRKELNFAFFENEGLKDLSPSDAANQYLKDYIENYKKDIQAQYTEDEEMPSNYFSYNQTLSNRIAFNSINLLAVQIITTDKKGGTKAANLYRNFVFNLETGEQLRERNIFIAEYATELNALLLRKMMEQMKVKTLDELYDIGFYDLDNFESNNNFLIDNKGITYIYNQLGFSTKAIGETQLFLPFGEIKYLLKEESPISPLFK